MRLEILRGGRLGKTSKIAAAFTTSVDSDRVLYRPVVKINTAHMMMLIKQGLVDKRAGQACIKALDVLPARMSLDPMLEDVHMNVEAKVILKVGEAVGGNLNLGKSRNDQVATAIRMVLREHLLELVEALVAMRKVFLKKADEHLNTLMPGYTHLQHAQPSTLAHHFTAYCDAVERDCERIIQLFDRVNKSPMGAGAFAGTWLPIDRSMVAELLGFHGLVENSIDAVTSRDFLLEALSTFSILMTNLSRVAQEIILWSTLEFGIVEVPDEYASTSSIMPQKKNPVVAEIVRAKASSVEGELVACMSLLKALPSGYQLDLQEATPHLWRACDTCLASCRVLTGMMAKVLFNKHRLAELADEGYVTATDLADYLATRLKVPFRTAHSIVGGMVKESVVGKKSFESVVRSRLTGEVQKATGRVVRISFDELKWVLDPRLSMERRVVIGGPSPKEVARVLKMRRMLLEQHLSWVRMKQARLKKADEQLKGGEFE